MTHNERERMGWKKTIRWKQLLRLVVHEKITRTNKSWVKELLGELERFSSKYSQASDKDSRVN